MPLSVIYARALPTLMTLALLLALSACGTNTGSPGTSSTPLNGDQPDRVQIQVQTVSPASSEHPLLTLTQASLVLRLYSTTLALPEMPQDRACTDELGPSYKLTFWHGERTLTALTAQRFSCQAVTFEGSQGDRQATPDFWSLVDQAIYAATPVGEPQWLAMLHVPRVDQPPLSARISSAETTRRLYDAILALPQAPAPGGCSTTGTPEYALLFHQADLAIPAQIDLPCNTINLEGKYHVRGGRFIMTDTFKQLLQQMLAGATFAPARPDQLSLTVQTGSGTTSNQTVTDASLRQQIYARAFTLPAAPASLPQTCDQNDKVNGKGKWYTLDFSQWGLSLLHLELFEGSCKLITLYPAGKLVQGDATFWDLLHRAAQG
jgi:hypothetical protein